MNFGNMLRGSLLVGLLAVLAGAFFKIMHYPGADWLLIGGLLASLAFAGLALVEIAGSRRASGGEKILWITVLLLGNVLGALLYLLVGRRRFISYPG